MSALSNESSSQEVCAEETLLNCRLRQFVPSRSALRLTKQRKKSVKSRRRTRGIFMSALSNESSSQEVCAEETLLFSAIAQRF